MNADGLGQALLSNMGLSPISIKAPSPDSSFNEQFLCVCMVSIHYLVQVSPQPHEVHINILVLGVRKRSSERVTFSRFLSFYRGDYGQLLPHNLFSL